MLLGLFSNLFPVSIRLEDKGKDKNKGKIARNKPMRIIYSRLISRLFLGLIGLITIGLGR